LRDLIEALLAKQPGEHTKYDEIEAALAQFASDAGSTRTDKSSSSPLLQFLGRPESR
jgi:hypothetical protein